MTKAPSSRELQLLAVLASEEGSEADAAELSGRQIGKIYERYTEEIVSYGLVYASLADLEEAGWVQARDEIHDGRPTRFYQLTPSGANALRRGRTHAESTEPRRRTGT